MRKNKTWEITLTDNSRLVANEPIENAVVYTTDTEAYLNFRVIDSGFDFDSATIAMLNKDDGSIVERPMTKEVETAVYEIESDIIPHFGLWQAQVLFKQGEEIFTSTPVTFVIERYMMAEQPPRLEDVVNWQRLYDNAVETIQELTRINDELTNTNETVQQAEAQRVLAENERSEKYGSYAQQFNDVITDLSEEKDYHSLPEISAARGGHDTLGQRLDETTAQLAQTNSRFDDVITTPVDGNITQQEIIDARHGFISLGENFRNIREVSENKLIDQRTNTPFLYNFEIDSNGVLNFIVSEMPLTLKSIVWEDLTLEEIFSGNMLLKTNYTNLTNATNITVGSSTNILSWEKITSTQNTAHVRSEALPLFNKAYVKLRYKTTAVQGIMRFSGDTTVITKSISEDNSWVEDSYYGLFSPRETYPVGIRFEFVNLNPEQAEFHVDLNKSTLIDLDIFNDLPTKEQLDEWHDIYTQLNGGYQ